MISFDVGMDHHYSVLLIKFDAINSNPVHSKNVRLIITITAITATAAIIAITAVTKCSKYSPK